MDTLEFLKMLYTGCKQGNISVMTLPDRKIEHIPIAKVEEAAHKLVKYGESVNSYFGVGLRREGLPVNLRGGASDIVCLTCLFADIDVYSEAHRQQALPKTKEIAQEFLNALQEPPSIISDSGHGLQAFWLLRHPFYIKSEDDSKTASDILSGFGQHIQKEGEKQGWKFDPVFDIARMLRAPGSINHKIGQRRPCLIIASNETRYDIKIFDKYKCVTPILDETPDIDPRDTGEANRIINKCKFVAYCRDNASCLPEPLWFAMLSNVSLASDGQTAAHFLSKAYPDYNYNETQYKIDRAMKQRKPHTCRCIKENYGFECPENGCGVKAPIVLAVLSLSERLHMFMVSEINDEDALSSRTLLLMSYAREREPLEYTKFKMTLKKPTCAIA